MNKLTTCILIIMAMLSTTLTGMQTAEAASDNQGFLYGVVTTESGKDYTGFLRWGDEESFWDDLFHSSKDDLPYLEEFEDEDRDGPHRDDERTIKIFGYKLKVNKDHWEGSSSRVFIARFGDIEYIEGTGDNDARVYMKSGERYDVSGYANDVGGTVYVHDSSLGEIDIHWDRIDTIRFQEAPGGADPEVFRLHGKLTTRHGDYEGYIQWDKQECISTDKLDGEAEDGDVSIPMGRISSIERYGRGASEVVLKDGRSFRLRDSNDVDDDNRGIMVEDPRYGRVVVFWDEFDKLEFSDPGGSGKGYGDYDGGSTLKGAVTDRDGNKHEGRLVFDLDETESWEILNGSARDIEYNIPFSMISRIEPMSHDESKIFLRGGEELRLEDGQDVSERNDGMLIFANGDRNPVYIPWREIDQIEFAK